MSVYQLSLIAQINVSSTAFQLSQQYRFESRDKQELPRYSILNTHIDVFFFFLSEVKWKFDSWQAKLDI